ncbi:DUF2510 domain-containing protein [Microcella sp.]|uniref:DUF2510 domain-containing protein n=1 Tax=Microcella sp. TaxID=1913979 RepID=UPI00256201EE|nr:DUF2510 domain-containing protein [Microcella sp.]MBX9471044.1 DUF2510 domain-containing protein [Microcella sp.]
MTADYTPQAGWYDDPERALRLRWWDGARWTTHTRAKTIVEPVPVAAGVVDMSSSDALAVPGMTEPYGYSAPYSWSPATPSAAAASATEPPVLGTWKSHTRRTDELWNTSAQSMDYTPERTTTPAAWALAFTPLVTVLAQTAAVVLTGFESTPAIWILGAMIIPILWIIMFVRRDRITLHEWGHLRRAHWGWAFLGALGYLVARTIVVRKQATGRGWWPLLTNLAITAVLVNIGLFTPALGVLRTVIF